MDITNDKEMLSYGRNCARLKMIREAREEMRNLFAQYSNSENVEDVKYMAEEFIKQSEILIAALNIKVEKA